jgi:hypothetical protein
MDEVVPHPGVDLVEGAADLGHDVVPGVHLADLGVSHIHRPLPLGRLVGRRISWQCGYRRRRSRLLDDRGVDDQARRTGVVPMAGHVLLTPLELVGIGPGDDSGVLGAAVDLVSRPGEVVG